MRSLYLSAVYGTDTDFTRILCRLFIAHIFYVRLYAIYFAVNHTLILTARGLSKLTVSFDNVQSNLTPASGYLTLEVPCNTRIVSFEVTVEEGQGRFIASYSQNLWNTGDGSFVCTTDKTLVTQGWRTVGKYQSS